MIDLGVLDHLPTQFRLGLEGARLGNTHFLTSLGIRIAKPTLRQVKLTINPGMGTRGRQGQKNADLAHFHFAQASIVLATCTSAVITSLFISAFIQDQHRPSLEFRMRLDIVLHSSDQPPSRPG